MRALVQRVSRAQVQVGERLVGTIEQGLLVLLGVRRAIANGTWNIWRQKS